MVRKEEVITMFKEQRDLLEASLEKLIVSLDDKEQFQKMAKVMANFHNYSFRNQMLIFYQKPDATHVAGFRAWKKMSRSVTAGSSGIRILAPCKYGTEKYAVRTTDKASGQQIGGDEGFEENTRMFFKTATVFDISQTSGKELPDVRNVSGDKFKDLMAAAIKFAEEKVEVKFVNTGTSGGFTDGKIIALQSANDPDRQLATLFHEIAHVHLSHVGSGLTKETKEYQAEVCAHVAALHFGLDIGSNTYIQSWSDGGKPDKNVIRNVFADVNRCSQTIISGVGKYMNGGDCGVRKTV